MNEFAKSRADYISGLYRHGAFPQYATVEQCLDLIDLPTFNLGVTLFRNQTGLPGDTNDVAGDNPAFFCARPTIMFARGGTCKIPNREFTWHTVGGAGQISAADFKACMEMSWGWWASGIDIAPRYSANEKTATLVARWEQIDGPSNVLAFAELPCGIWTAQRQLKQVYEPDRLVIAENPPAGSMDLARIVAHESGHSLQLEHGQRGLMRPTYDPRMRQPSEDDFSRLVPIYGRATSPAPVPTPTPVPTPSPGVVSRIQIDIDANGRIMATPQLTGWLAMRSGA